MNTNEIINNIEQYAKENNIPIMMKDAINYICEHIKENKIKTVLEIGTAIGYSAIKMCESGAKITTIERDKERFKIAVQNVNVANMKDKIELILNDAFNTDITSQYDMILIDAAKGKNIEFIEKFKTNLKQDGTIIIDNVDFHGLVGKSEEIKSKNLRSLVKKIEKFLSFLETQTEFKVTKINKGDGLIILKYNK